MDLIIFINYFFFLCVRDGLFYLFELSSDLFEYDFNNMYSWVYELYLILSIILVKIFRFL